MKKLLCSLMVSMAALQISAAELAWLTDLAKAQVQPRKKRRWCSWNFTGSDW